VYYDYVYLVHLEAYVVQEISKDPSLETRDVFKLLID